MQLSLLSWLFQTVPESLAAVSLAVVLCTGKLEWKRIILTGLFFAAVVYLVRLLPLAFGVHFIVLTIIMSMLLTIQQETGFSRCLFAALSAGIILAIFETAFVFAFIVLTGIPIEQTIQGLYSYIAFAWPHIIALFLLALTISRWKKSRSMKEGNT